MIYLQYNPDFYSKPREKEAVTLITTGFAAYTFCQEHVGDTLSFCSWPKYFSCQPGAAFAW